MEQIENNKLIAEFMEYKVKVFKGREYFQPTLEPYVYLTDGRDDLEELQNFSESWDWLMPVVEKIHQIKKGSIEIHSNSTKVSYNGESFIFAGAIKNSLNNTYKAVVQFIEWYNKNKQ